MDVRLKSSFQKMFPKIDSMANEIKDLREHLLEIKKNQRDILSKLKKK